MRTRSAGASLLRSILTSGMALSFHGVSITVDRCGKSSAADVTTHVGWKPP
jgi:hypothetical protein